MYFRKNSQIIVLYKYELKNEKNTAQFGWCFFKSNLFKYPKLKIVNNKT